MILRTYGQPCSTRTLSSFSFSHETCICRSSPLASGAQNVLRRKVDALPKVGACGATQAIRRGNVVLGAQKVNHREKEALGAKDVAHRRSGVDDDWNSVLQRNGAFLRSETVVYCLRNLA